MRPELKEKHDKLKAAATDLIGDYVREYDDFRVHVAELENALAMKKVHLAMVDDQIAQLTRSVEALDRE